MHQQAQPHRHVPDESRATEHLVTASQEFGKRLYEQASASAGEAGGGATGGSSGAPNDDEVVDAEIVDEQGA